MRVRRSLAYGAAFCAVCSEIASAITLDLTSTGEDAELIQRA